MAHDFAPWSAAFVAWYRQALGEGRPVTDELVWSRVTEALIAITGTKLAVANAVALFSDDEGLLFVSPSEARRIARAWRVSLAQMRAEGRLFDSALLG